MKLKFALLLILSGTAFATPPPGYKLAWSDEFNSTKLDASQWDYRLDEAFFSAQKSENVSLGNGKLKVALKAEKVGDKNYTGGGVVSRREFLYGYYEARVKVPATQGWHTAFWTTATSTKTGIHRPGVGPHELDILEQDSVVPMTAKRCLWMRKRKAGSNPLAIADWPKVALEFPTPDLSKAFHTWGCEFTPRTVRYFFEDKEIARWDVSGYEHGLQRILLTCISVRHGKPVEKVGPVDAELPAYAEFDYIRFYESEIKGH